MPTVPEGLPPWANAVASLIILIGFGLTVWQGRKKTAPSTAPNTLIAGDIMSTKPMADLAKNMADLVVAAARIEGALEHNTEAVNRQEAATRAVEGAVRSSEAATRDLCRTIEKRD